MPRAAPLITVTLAERVAAALEQRIARGSPKTGTKLPTVAALAVDFGVSQPVVREALSRLRSQGLIATRHGSGSVVLEPRERRGYRVGRHGVWDRRALTELFAFRADIESGSAAQAAIEATRDDLVGLRTALQRLERHLNDEQLGPDADLAFHQSIARATHNRYRLKLVGYLHREMHDAIHIARGNSALRPGLMEQVHMEHEAILRAIAAGDAPAAADAMRAHVCNAARRLGLVSPRWLAPQVYARLRSRFPDWSHQ